MAERKELTIDELKDGMKVTDEQLDSRVEETDLPELAACFDNTEDYVEKLKLTPPQKNDVRTKFHQNGTQAGAKEALKCWRNNSPLMATFRALILILLLLSKGNVAVAVCKYLSDKCSSSCPTQPGILTNPGLLSYGDYLKSRYRVLVSASSKQWPPLPTTKIFKLAMIQKEKIQRGRIDDKFVRLTITGTVDDILQRKTPIQLENIFAHATKGRRFVLIEGAPGSGKSTLALHICQEWAKGELFKEYDVVILVRLRDPHIRKAKTVADLLPCADIAMAHETEAAMKSVHGRGILWVLDGWDELPSDLPQDSIINKLITPEISPLHECALIVTSRPSSSAELHPLVSSRVEVLGFTPTEMEQYFTECLNGNTQAVQTLLERIRENAAVESSCYLPLNASIVAHVYISGDHSLPTSNHGIFTSVVKFSLSRYMQDRLGMSSKQAVITTWDALPKNVRNLFSELCKLAYYGVTKNKVTFVTDDFRAAGVSMKVCDLGLLQTVSSVLVDGRESYFNFLNLSIQELLAAMQISLMSATDQMAVFKDLFGTPRFNAVFEFYAGITKLKTCRPLLSLLPKSFFPNTPRGILDLISKMVKAKQILGVVSLLRCLYEAGDPALCVFVASLLEPPFEFTPSSPLDCLSIGYFLSCLISTSVAGNFITFLQYRHIGDQGCKFLTQGLSKCLNSHSNVTSKLDLYLGSNDISEVGVQHIATLLKNTTILHKLSLSRNEAIGDRGLKALSEALATNTTLEELDLSDCSISMETLLMNASTVRKLNLSRNKTIGDRGLETLSEALSMNTTLEVLDLSLCSISGAGVQYITTILTNTTSVRTLILAWNESIGDSGLERLNGALSINTTLEVLDLSRCSISDVGLQHIATLLKNTTALRKLNLSSNKATGGCGLERLCKALSTNTTLEELYLKQCSISLGGVRNIAALLENTSAVRKLSLSHNEAIGDRGLKALSEALATNTTLEELDLSGCSISDSLSLCQLLSTNKSLTHLDLMDNSLSACYHLATGLSNNHTLKTLHFACKLTDQSVADLCFGLANNRIQELHIVQTSFNSLKESVKVLTNCLTTLSNMRQMSICSLQYATLNETFYEVMKVVNKTRKKNGLPEIATQM